VTDRRKEERDRLRRERRRATQRLQEEKSRRLWELTEAWRRNHPTPEEEDGRRGDVRCEPEVERRFPFGWNLFCP
jgi:hypothetical protein